MILVLVLLNSFIGGKTMEEGNKEEDYAVLFWKQLNEQKKEEEEIQYVFYS